MVRHDLFTWILRTFVLLFFVSVSLCVASGMSDEDLIVLTWTPNPEQDVVGYRVYIGKQPDVYDRWVDVGGNTAYLLNDFQIEEGTFHFAVAAYDRDGNESALSEDVPFLLHGASQVSQTVRLYQNFPNPFNGLTRIWYFLPESRYVRVCIWDAVGREVDVLFDMVSESGMRTLVWDGRDRSGLQVASGFYVVTLELSDLRLERKLVYLR